MENSIIENVEEISEFDVAELDLNPPDPDDFFAKNAFRIVYQTNNFFLPQIRDLIDKGEVLNLRPEYQRRLRWNAQQKSRLIESLLLNIPIPPVFLYESDAARYEVMDGQQRLNTVREFIEGGFQLTGLQALKPLNGLRYLRCPPRIKRSLDRASLSAIVLLLESEPAGELSMADIRRFVFDRLNTGGTKLNQQEIRNAVYPGYFNNTLVDLSRYRLFTDTFEIPPYVEADQNEYYENETRKNNSLYSSMADCQLVLRYFALKDDDNIRGAMRAMLDRAMEDRMRMSEDEANVLTANFKNRFAFLHSLFEGKPFRLATSDHGRARVSAALYDSSMVAADKLWEFRHLISDDAVNVRTRMLTALKDSQSLRILTGQGNTANAVRDRIALMKQVLHPSV